ncbi:MAG: hypothetical protein VB032_00835, partial [Burkholderiaceae bacterium]|nr:hypothetical protein [Burkholderiaceae bacterium]
VAIFIRSPVQGYFDMQTRTELTDEADTALRRIGRDLHLAVPNSIRLSGNTTMEFLQTRTGGRYVASRTGNVLDYASATDNTFSVLPGSMLDTPLANEYVVIYNLGIPGADAYATTPFENRARITGATATSVTLASAFDFPLDSPGRRFQVVDTPVTYRCDLSAGTLTRYWGYAINATQPDPPSGSGVQSALLAQGVKDVLDKDGKVLRPGCAFTYDSINERLGLVTMTLSLTRNNETVTLYHEVHVSNIP